MKNFKKIALGLMVGAMAIGFSSFINSSKSHLLVKRNAKGKIISVTTSYFRLPADASTGTDMNASHYVFSDGALADCISGTNNVCKSEWTTTNTPADGQSPADAGSPTFVSNDGSRGIYNGN
jgi:hypothetical protein